MYFLLNYNALMGRGNICRGKYLGREEGLTPFPLPPIVPFSRDFLEDGNPKMPTVILIEKWNGDEESGEG